MKPIPTATTWSYLPDLLHSVRRLQPSGDPESRAYRFLDHLDSRNVVRYQSLHLRPLKRYLAIHDLGIIRELAQIKKKVIFQDLALNAILAPPESEFRFEVHRS